MEHTKLFLKEIAYLIADSIDNRAMLDRVITVLQSHVPQNPQLVNLCSKDIISERKHQSFGLDCKNYAELLLEIGDASDKREAISIDEAFDDDISYMNR